jgi:hypothetical protein
MSSGRRPTRSINRRDRCQSEHQAPVLRTGKPVVDEERHEDADGECQLVEAHQRTTQLGGRAASPMNRGTTSGADPKRAR